MLNKMNNYWLVGYTELKQLVSAHRLALILFPLLAALFLNDVLFSNKSLGAFDILLAQPSFNTEFEFKGIHEPIIDDSPYAHYPERKLNWELFRQGHNFNFTPYIFSGTSYTGRKTGAFITSFPQLFFDTPNAIDWSTWLRLALAGIFMYSLLVTVGLHRAGAILAGVLWTYNMHQIAWLEFPQHLATQLWMPLLLLLNIQLIKSKERVPLNLIIGLVVANLLIFTSGYTQIVLYFYFFIGLFNTLYIAFDRDHTILQRLKKWLLVNSIYIVAMGVLVADILSELNDIKLGLRGSQGFRERDADIVIAFSTIIEFFQNITPNTDELKRFYSPDYLGGIWGKWYDRLLHGNIIEGGTYYGVIGLLLSFYSITGLKYLKDKRLYFVLLFLFFFFVGFYYGDPLISALFNLIPFGGSGSYSRIITLLILILCILAGYGLSHLVDDIAAKKYKKIAITVAIFVSIPILARVFDEAFFLRKFSYSYIVIAITTGIVILAVALKRKNVIPYAIILVCIVDLFAVTYDFNTRMRNSRIFPENKTIRYLQSDAENFRVAVFAEGPIYHHNILSYYNLPVIGGYLTVAPTDYFNFIRRVYKNVHISLNGKLFLLKGGNLDILRLMNVKYIISEDVLQTDKAELVHYNNNNYVYRILDNLPRAYCASDYIKISSEADSISAVVDALERFDRPVVSSSLPIPAGQLTEACSVSDLQVYINQLKFNVSSDEASVVLLPYGFSKFWQATVNDKPVNVHRVNSQLMAVAVPAGSSQIDVLYLNNYEVTASAIKIGVGLLAIAILLIWGAPGIVPASLILVLAILVWKNSFSLPGIKNDEIPERPTRAENVVPETTGLQRMDADRESVPIFASQVYQTQFISPINGLKRVALLVSTPQKTVNDYDLKVIIRDAETGHSIEQKVSSRGFHGKRWFDLKFDEFSNSRNAVFDIEVSAESATAANAPKMALDDKNKLSIITYHNPHTAYQ
ncbi:MAG: YfhO family protein [Arenicellales bacterium]